MRNRMKSFCSIGMDWPLFDYVSGVHHVVPRALSTGPVTGWRESNGYQFDLYWKWDLAVGLAVTIIPSKPRWK